MTLAQAKIIPKLFYVFQKSLAKTFSEDLERHTNKDPHKTFEDAYQYLTKTLYAHSSVFIARLCNHVKLSCFIFDISLDKNSIEIFSLYFKHLLQEHNKCLI